MCTIACCPVCLPGSSASVVHLTMCTMLPRPPPRFLIFFMQVGFVALEVGSSRAKNTKNILVKNLLDVQLCALCWWAIGFPFAYGNDAANGFIG